MGRNKRNKKKGPKKPPAAVDPAIVRAGPSTATVTTSDKLGKSEAGPAQGLEPGGAAASACTMETGDASGSALPAGLVCTDDLVTANLVGASSYPHHSDGAQGASNGKGLDASLDNASVAVTPDKSEVEFLDKQKKLSNGQEPKSCETSVKRKFSDMEDEEESLTQYSGLVAQHASTATKKSGGNAEGVFGGAVALQSMPEPPAVKAAVLEKAAVKQTAKNKALMASEKKESVETAVIAEAAEALPKEDLEQKQKCVRDAEKKEYDRKIVPGNLAGLWEMKYQLHLASLQKTVEIVVENGEAVREEKKAPVSEEIVKQAETKDVTSAMGDGCEDAMSTTLAASLRAECQKLREVKTARDAEMNFWESNRDNSHGRKTVKSTEKDRQKESKKTKFSAEQEEREMNREQAKAVFRKRGTKSMSDESEPIKRGDLKKTRASLSMSDIQHDVEGKLTYAEMVIKGEKDRRARFEVTLSQCLSEEYKSISRLQIALVCESNFQKYLVSQNSSAAENMGKIESKNITSKENDENKSESKNTENTCGNESKKRNQRKRKKSRSKSKEVEIPEKPEVAVEKAKIVHEVKSSPKPNKARPGEKPDKLSSEQIDLPEAEDFAKRLKEEMCQRASAETMVRMLETETTEQRHALAEERGKIAKLEALVVHLESELKEKILISDEYKTRLEATEKHLQETTARMIKLESGSVLPGQLLSSTDYMMQDYGKDASFAESLRVKELEDELQRHKDKLDLSAMRSQPETISVMDHQDILQAVELRAQQAEIKALQLENELLKLKNTKEAWSAASPTDVSGTLSDQQSGSNPHTEFSLSAASLFSGLAGLGLPTDVAGGQTGVSTSTFQLPAFFTSPTTSVAGAAAFGFNPSGELQFGSAFSPYNPDSMDTTVGHRRGGTEFESLSSDSDWSISDEEAGSSEKQLKSKRAAPPAESRLSDQTGRCFGMTKGTEP